MRFLMALFFAEMQDDKQTRPAVDKKPETEAVKKDEADQEAEKQEGEKQEDEKQKPAESTDNKPEASEVKEKDSEQEGDKS